MTSVCARAATRRLRVLLLTNSVAMGGMERHVELLARDLDRTSFDVFTVCPNWPAIEEFDATLRRVSDHHMHCTPDRRWGVCHEVRQVWQLYRQLKAWHIDIMHMHLTTFKGGMWVVLVARLAGVRAIVCTEHLAPDAPPRLSHRVLRCLFGHLVDQLVCVSEKNKEARARYLYTPLERTSVVVNGIDSSHFDPVEPSILAELRQGLGIPEDACIVGSVVRLEPEKGLNYLLDAMPIVRERFPGAYVLLVGSGSLQKQLEDQARQLGIHEQVIFAGFHPDPRPYLALMDVFVLPVPVGSMSIGLLEAMAMHRAVIITFGDPGEAVIHEESGLCAPPRNPRELAQAITRLLAEPALARAYGEAARRRVEDYFSATTVARQLSSLYRSLAQSCQ